MAMMQDFYSKMAQMGGRPGYGAQAGGNRQGYGQQFGQMQGPLQAAPTALRQRPLQLNNAAAGMYPSPSPDKMGASNVQGKGMGGLQSPVSSPYGAPWMNDPQAFASLFALPPGAMQSETNPEGFSGTQQQGVNPATWALGNAGVAPGVYGQQIVQGGPDNGGTYGPVYTDATGRTYRLDPSSGTWVPLA